MRPVASSLLTWTLALCVVAAQLTGAPRQFVEAADSAPAACTDRDRLQPAGPSHPGPHAAIFCTSGGEAVSGRNPVRSLLDFRLKPDAVADRSAVLLARAVSGCRLSTSARGSTGVLSQARNLPLLL